jgi:hypothetical protein
VPVPVSLSLGSSFLSLERPGLIRNADTSRSLTIAEYFRDEEGQDVLLFIDNIFRFTQGEPPPRAFSRFFRADVCPV